MPSPTEPVAALSQCVVPQLAALILLEEEFRVAPRRLLREYGSTSIITALDAAVLYNAFSACDYAIRHLRARSRAMQVEKEAAVDVDEVTASTSPPAAIIDEK